MYDQWGIKKIIFLRGENMTDKKDNIFDDDLPGEEDFDKPEKSAADESDNDIPEDADEEAAEGSAEDESDELIEPEEFDIARSETVRMTGDVLVQVAAVLGKKTMSVKELVGLHVGGLIDLSRPPNEVVDLVANGKLIAKGELVEIDGKLGVKIVKMVR